MAAHKVDWSSVPCAGMKCFGHPVAERKACSEQAHDCPFHVKYSADWLCRCCPDCVAECLKEVRDE